MKHWRPENWNNPYRTEEVADKWSGFADDVPAPFPTAVVTTYDILQYRAFEAGADAMLEALFKAAKESPTGTFIIDSKVINIYTLKGG